MDSTLLIWILVFLTGFMFVEFLASALAGSRRGRAHAQRRLHELFVRVHASEAAESVSILREQQGLRVGLLGAALERVRVMKPLELLLYRAGRPIGLGQFLLLSAGLAVGGLLLADVLLGASALGPACSLAGLLPLVYVYVAKRRRMRRFEALLPEALDLLARALRAGHAMSASLQMVGQELGEPIGPEFAQVAEEIQYGLDMHHALANLSHRVDIEDMPFFVTALVIQRETGGNLAEIIDNLGSVIRARHATQGKIRALTAQTRWSANILLCAPFVFVGLMSLFSPHYIEPLFTTRAGNVLCVVATLMVLVGYALCRRVGVVKV